MSLFRQRGRLDRLPAPLRPLVRAVLDPLRRLGQRARGLVGRLRPGRVRDTFAWLRGAWRDVARRRREDGLTVAVDINPLYGPLTGVGWFLHSLLRELADRDDVRLRLYGPWMGVHPDDPRPTVPLPEGRAVELVEFVPVEGLVVRRDFLVRWLRRLAFLLVAADRNRVLFAPNYVLPRHFRRARGRLVVAVYDLSVRHFPWTLQDETYRALTAGLDRALERADAVLTISDTVRREIEAEGVDARVETVYPGPGHLSHVEPRPDEIPAGLGHPFVLHVGTREPRKNLGVLLAACQRLHRRRGGAGEPILLALCGAAGWKSEDLEEPLRRGREEGWLIELGYVSDGLLASLYGRALCLASPSLYEGFGLPLVEAMHAGTPLVCSDIPVFREVAAEAALYAPVDDPEAWAEQIERLAGAPELRRRLADAGRRQLARFDWGRAADRTLELWRRAAQSA